MGRSGVIVHRIRALGGFDIVTVRDVLDREFATRIGNIFVTGTDKAWVSLPKGAGVKLSVRSLRFLPFAHSSFADCRLNSLQIAEERDQRRRQKEKSA
jgi:hypothetical protein